LHAYNIFFQEERQRILSELPSPPKDDEASKYVIGGKRKRRRRTTHGKISFSSLAKLIGEKWKAIENEQREHYEQLAAVDLQRYHDEMDAYNAKMKDNEKPTKSTSTKARAKNDNEELLNESNDDEKAFATENTDEGGIEGDSMESADDVATKNI
jgi:HMG (high mobility group) box